MSKEVLRAENLSYAYEGEEKKAVDGVSFSVNAGDFVAILGQNGSGKSTLAKLLNGLYQPTSGKVFVLGMDTSDDNLTWEIRRAAGEVFQNPDNQLVATMVREDVAFGLENIGVKTEEMPERIDRALETVGMKEHENKAPHLLSGGQKQRVAIAGVLAMQPEIIIFDEATAMLDPKGRREVFDTVRRLNLQQHITVCWITHFMEEAAQAGYIYVMQDGQITLQGTPREIFSQAEALRKMRLDVPPITGLCLDLQKAGIPIQPALTVEEMAAEVEKIADA